MINLHLKRLQGANVEAKRQVRTLLYTTPGRRCRWLGPRDQECRFLERGRLWIDVVGRTNMVDRVKNKAQVFGLDNRTGRAALC